MIEPIRVFISYSGNDWDSFVKPFATQLLGNGINAVVANWDIQAGQSLVRRIFDEEIPRAQAIIIVLSVTSVTKAWVLEELDHATVRRIEDKLKLIPVKIDNCEIPPALRTIKRISYRANDSFTERTGEVIGAIYGHSRKPGLGKPPMYIQQQVKAFPELSQGEAHVLDALIKDCLEQGVLDINVHRNAAELHALGLTEDQINRNVAKLKARSYLQEHRMKGSGLHYTTQISVHVAAKYCRERYPQYDDVQTQVAAKVASLASDEFLIEPFPDEVPDFVYRTLVGELARDRIITATWTWERGVHLLPASPFIDEWLEGRR